MADGSESSRRQDNSRVTSALITGAFGLMGTVVTIFAMRQSVPTVAPQTDATLAAPSSVAASLPQSLPVESFSTAVTPQSAGNPLFNFAEFQARLAKPGLSQDDRNRIVRPLLGNTVVWQGYVDSVTEMTAPTADAAITVTLVESPDKLTQTMFKSPAHFRFGRESLQEVAALEVGDRAILSGTLADHYLIMTIVRDAHVKSVNGRPVGRAAAAPERAATH